MDGACTVAAVNLTGREAEAGNIGCWFPPGGIIEEEWGVGMLIYRILLPAGRVYNPFSAKYEAAGRGLLKVTPQCLASENVVGVFIIVVLRRWSLKW